MQENNAEGKNQINQRHDNLFRKALENPIVAKEFIEAHVPADIKKLIDLNTLKLEHDTFIEKNLQKTICDVLFSAKIDGRDGYLFLLLEHQSKPDYWMALRLMKYMISICSRYLDQNPKAKKLPLVYPLILYNGKQKYTAAKNLWDLFADKDRAKQLWMEDHLVVNVHEIPDEEFKQRAWSGIMEFFLKNIHERNLMQALEQIQEVIPKLIEVKDVGLGYLELILYYSLTGVEKNDKVRLEKLLKSYLNKGEEEEVMVSLARHWMNEGKQEGKQEGRQEGRQEGINIGIEKTAINMLKKTSDLEFISEVTGLSELQIRRLQRQI